MTTGNEIAERPERAGSRLVRQAYRVRKDDGVRLGAVNSL